MLTANFTEFRKHAKAYLDKVERGETIRILRHGKPIADVIPATKKPRVPSWKKPGLQLVIERVSPGKEIIKARRKARY